MYLYKCTICGCAEVGDHLKSTSNCPECGSIAYGLRPRVYVSMACRMDDRKAHCPLSDEDLRIMTVLLLNS